MDNDLRRLNKAWMSSQVKARQLSYANRQRQAFASRCQDSCGIEWGWGLGPVTALRAMPGAHNEAGHRNKCTLPIQCQLEVKDPSQHEDVENCFGNASDADAAPAPGGGASDCFGVSGTAESSWPAGSGRLRADAGSQ